MDSIEITVAVLEERIRNLDKALELQAREYSRRLEELNHSHQQQVDRNAMYVSRESWELSNKELNKALEIRAQENAVWQRAVDRWRWISVGAGVAGGGIIAGLTRLIE